MSLERFWAFLESRPTGAAVMAEWVSRCGPALPAVEPILEPTPQRAASHPSPKRHHSPLRIVGHTGGRIVGVCDEGCCERVKLAPVDIVVHAVDAAALRRLICGALGIKTAREPVGSLPGAIPLGHWEPRPGLRVRVALAAVADEVAHLLALQEVLVGSKRPPIILTPGRSLWSAVVQSIADAWRATLVPCTEIIGANGSGWHATDAWPVFQRGHLERAGLATPAQARAAKPKRKRESRATTLDGLKRELREHLRAAKAHYHGMAERGRADLLPRPTQQDLARRLGVSEPTVSRCLNDELDQELKMLWAGAADIDYVRRFKG